MRPEPVRLVALGIYDADGRLRRRIPVDENGKLAEPLEDIDHPQMVYSMIENEGRQIVAVPWMTKAPGLVENRWAAFTNDELFLLMAWSDYFEVAPGGAYRRNPETSADNERIKTEINAELERRTGNPPPE